MRRDPPPTPRPAAEATPAETGRRAPIRPADPAAIAQAAQRLRDGDLVAFPTETVYGLGGDGLNVDALARIFDAKGRPRFDPLILHVADAPAADALVAAWPGAARRLAEAFWPGPLTLVLPKRDLVPDLATAGLPTVAVRVPADPVAHALLQAVDRPVAAPSANRFGRVSPTRASHVAQAFSDQVLAMVLDGGPCLHGVESTVVQPDDQGVTLLRPGGVTVEAIERVIGQPLRMPDAPRDDAAARAMPAPGMLSRHYAPLTPLDVAAWPQARTSPDPAAALLCVTPPPQAPAGYARVEVLAPDHSLAHAAARLFDVMRELDRAGLARIVAVLGPSEGLGLAINDRLVRAAARA